MINFNDEASYRSYFENIAAQHVDISSFMYGDDQVGLENARSGESGPFILWLDYYPPIQGAGEPDNYLGQITALFDIITPVSTREETIAERQAKYKACEDIVQQLFARVIKDNQEWQDGDVYGNQLAIQQSKFGQMNQVTLGSSDYMGCAAELVFYVPLKVEYDATKWA